MDARPLSRRRFFARLAGRLRPAPARHAALRVSEACRNHQLCAAFCRTGALRTYTDEAGAAAGIAFDTSACDACGDCARACPERALALFVAQAKDAAANGVAFLTRWALRECRECGERFTDTDTASSLACPSCRKTRALARADFPRLFSSAGKGSP
ncbi:MAG TPA: 4Fe-4S binding protein [Burkholderiales bacterium]|nr:4Fe-4S binding protein [Burkholderiales bacterium]